MKSEERKALIATRFAPVGGTSNKIRCVLCGVKGYQTRGFGWMSTHLRKHFPCSKCGKMLSSRENGTARDHTRCPKTIERVEI